MIGVPHRQGSFPFCCRTIKTERLPSPAYRGALESVGDHVRNKRIELGLTQWEVAAAIGVCEATVCRWEREKGLFNPTVSQLPQVIAFLGYDPRPAPSSFGQKIVWLRSSLGMKQCEAAREIGVDQTTLGGWERDERIPTKESARKLEMWKNKVRRLPQLPPEWAKPIFQKAT